MLLVQLLVTADKTVTSTMNFYSSSSSCSLAWLIMFHTAVCVLTLADMVKAWIVVGAILLLSSAGMLLEVSLYPTWLPLRYMETLFPLVLGCTGTATEVLWVVSWWKAWFLYPLGPRTCLVAAGPVSNLKLLVLSRVPPSGCLHNN